MVSRNRRPVTENQPRQDRDVLPRVGLGTRFVTKYDPEKALRIIERVAEGETLNAICRGQPGMPHPTTFRRWMVNYPDLAKAYEVAIRISASSLEEEALDEARKIKASPKDGTHVRAAEVLIQQLRWSAERRDAAKFGQKAAVNIRVPVQIVTPIDLNLASGGESIPDIYTIDAKVLKSPEQAAKETDGGVIVKERPLIPGKHYNPFAKITNAERESEAIRTESSRSGDREEHLRPGDTGPNLPSSTEGPAYGTEGSRTEQNPEIGGKDE